MAVMRRHGEAKLTDSGTTVGQQPLLELRIGPCLGDNARAILRNPLLLDRAMELVDGLARLHAADFEDGLDRIDTLLDGGGGVANIAAVRHAFLLARGL